MKEGIVREFGIDKYTQLYFKWIYRDSTGDSAQCHVAAWMGRGFRGNGYMYTDS